MPIKVFTQGETREAIRAYLEESGQRVQDVTSSDKQARRLLRRHTLSLGVSSQSPFADQRALYALGPHDLDNPGTELQRMLRSYPAGDAPADTAEEEAAAPEPVTEAPVTTAPVTDTTATAATNDEPLPIITPTIVPGDVLAQYEAMAALIRTDVRLSQILAERDTALSVIETLTARLEDARQNKGEIREKLVVAGWIRPSWFPKLVRWVASGRTVAIVGPAGTGKTTATRYAAQALGIPASSYYQLDCTVATTADHLIGRPGVSTEGDVYRDGIVTRACQDERAMLVLNEYDALDPREAMALQSFFERRPGGRELAAPEHPQATGGVLKARDPSMAVVLTMNTLGDGPTRQYVGRNSLDAANLDRVSVLQVSYENEEAILEAHGFEGNTARSVVRWAETIREKINAAGLPIILSTRRLLDMAESIERFGLTLDQARHEEFSDRLQIEDQRALGFVS